MLAKGVSLPLQGVTVADCCPLGPDMGFTLAVLGGSEDPFSELELELVEGFETC